MYQELAAHIRELGSVGLSLLTEFVFPPTCAGCNAAGDWLCSRCGQKLAAIDQLSATRNRAHDSDAQILLRARYGYVEPVRRAIHLVKYERQYARAVWLAEQLTPLFWDAPRVESSIQPVPLTARRERQRGFNQAREIARHLSNVMGLQLGDDLHRIRETRPQVELNGLERIANVRGAFVADRAVAGKHVYLVDDVITTGATMRECAAACLEAGAANVVGIAVAMGQR